MTVFTENNQEICERCGQHPQDQWTRHGARQACERYVKRRTNRVRLQDLAAMTEDCEYIEKAGLDGRKARAWAQWAGKLVCKACVDQYVKDVRVDAINARCM